jgi:hypothetical protein
LLDKHSATELHLQSQKLNKLPNVTQISSKSEIQIQALWLQRQAC